jgi:hypothetical protein
LRCAARAGYRRAIARRTLHGRRAVAAVIAVVVALLVLAAAAGAAPPQRAALTRYTVPDPGTPPRPVPVGDFNGDGLNDWAVGNPSAGDGAGRASIVYGTRTPANLSLAGGSATVSALVGYRQIVPPSTPGTDVGESVAGLGDVNGDGLGDVLVGGADDAWVVFGHRGAAATVRADQLGAGGFRITFPGYTARSVQPMADLNGDKRADMVLQLNSRPGSGATPTSKLVVIFGGSATTTVDTRSLGLGGYTVTASGGRIFSNLVTGNFGNDKRPDMAVELDGPASTDVAILFGRSSAVVADAANPGQNGRVLTGATTPSPVGDLDGDGWDELGIVVPGEAWIVYGSDALGTTPALDSRSRAIRLTGLFDPRWVGDLDGDGRSDAGIQSATGLRLLSGADAPGRNSTLNASDPRLGLLAGAPQYPQAYPPNAFNGLGDVDGDGRMDIAYASHGALLSASSGTYDVRVDVTNGTVDRIPPDMGASGMFQPATFRAGASPLGTNVVLALSEPAKVTMRIWSVASGTLIVTARGDRPAGVSSGFWDGRVNGVPLPAGSYIGEFFATDAAGNRCPSTYETFTVKP